MNKYRIKEVKTGAYSKFYPQYRIWGLFWRIFTDCDGDYKSYDTYHDCLNAINIWCAEANTPKVTYHSVGKIDKLTQPKCQPRTLSRSAKPEYKNEIRDILQSAIYAFRHAANIHEQAILLDLTRDPIIDTANKIAYTLSISVQMVGVSSEYLQDMRHEVAKIGIGVYDYREEEFTFCAREIASRPHNYHPEALLAGAEAFESVFKKHNFNCYTRL